MIASVFGFNHFKAFYINYPNFFRSFGRGVDTRKYFVIVFLALNETLLNSARIVRFDLLSSFWQKKI